MNRQDAIALLAQRMGDAPNFGHYCCWLCDQPNELLFALAGLEYVSFSRLKEIERASLLRAKQKINQQLKASA